MQFLQTWQGLLWTLYCLATGIVLGSLWTSAPLKRQIEYLQSSPMERILTLEQLNRELSEELKWSQAKVKSQQVDLDRMNQKLTSSHWELSGMQAPQWNLSYWKFEGPKLQQRVLELESELESLRSKTLWKE